MNWIEEEKYLVKNFPLENYIDGLAFISQVAHLAQEKNHHPDIEYTYRKIIIRMTTHDQGSTVTEKDWELAEAIDQLNAIGS